MKKLVRVCSATLPINLLVCPVHALNWIILFSRIFCDKFLFKLNFPFWNVCMHRALKGIKHQYMTNTQSKQCRCSKIDWQGSRRNPPSKLNHCIRSSNAKRFYNRENMRQMENTNCKTNIIGISWIELEKWQRKEALTNSFPDLRTVDKCQRKNK